MVHSARSLRHHNLSVFLTVAMSPRALIYAAGKQYSTSVTMRLMADSLLISAMTRHRRVDHH